MALLWSLFEQKRRGFGYFQIVWFIFFLWLENFDIYLNKPAYLSAANVRALYLAELIAP